MPISGVSTWFGDAEETLFKNLGRELVEGFVSQHMTLYRIDVSKTDSNFYNESKHKVYKTPVEVLARIQISDTDVVSEGGVRRMSKGDLSAWVYDDLLTELGVEIHVGDFLKHANKFYEVYDPGYDKDSLNRKFAGDRDYYTEVLAKSVSADIFKSIEDGNI
jgi:hypothetical protein